MIDHLPGYECAKVLLQISSSNTLLTAAWPFVKPFKPYTSESLVFSPYAHEVQEAGRAAGGRLAAGWIAGDDRFHEETLYQACNDEVS